MYVVPLCFGYRDNTLYFYSSPGGKKIEILKKNDKVRFEFDLDHQVVRNQTEWQWSMKYRRVIGFGQASFVEDLDEKRKGLDAIMMNYSGRSFDYPKASIDNTVIIKVEIERITGKDSGY